VDADARPWFVEDDETIALVERPAAGYGVALFLEASLGLALLGALGYGVLSIDQPSYTRLVAPIATRDRPGARGRCLGVAALRDEPLRRHRQSASTPSAAACSRACTWLVEALLSFDTIVVSAYGDRGTSIEIPGLADADRLRSQLATSTLDTGSPRWLLRGD
jgi:hypothetical protein